MHANRAVAVEDGAATSSPSTPGLRAWLGLPLATLVVLGGLAAYRFFHLAAYPIYKGEHGADFGVFFGAARQIARGAPLYPDPGTPLTYMYPPTLALLLVPLTGLDPLTAGNRALTYLAYFVFAAVALGAVVVTVLLLSRFARQDRLAVAAALGIIALAAWPVHLLVRQGQVDSLTLVLMVGSLFLAWHRRSWAAALALGLAISIKVTPGVLVLYFLWKRQYQLAFRSLAAAAAIVLGSGLVVGFGDVATFFTRVLPRIGAEGQAYWYNQSLHSAFLRLFTTTPYTQPVADLGLSAAVLATGLTTALLLGATLVCVSRSWPASAPIYLVEAGAFALLEVLAASLSWQMHAVWALLPVAGLVLLAQEDRSRPAWFGVAVGLGALGFLAGPYEPPFEYGRFDRGWLTLLVSHTVAAHIFLLALCLYASRRRASGE